MSDDNPDLRSTLAAMVDESLRLRMAAQLPKPDASTGELLDALLVVRSSIDRMEELLATSLQLRGFAARKHTVCRVQVEDAWDEVAVRTRQSAVRDEYSSAKERAAAANLEVLDLRRLERRAQRDLQICDEAVESIRLRHRGASDLRQDVLAVIRIRQFETAMER